MAYINDIYLQQDLVDALHANDAVQIRKCAANPDGTLSTPYILDGCIPYAVSKNNIPLLKTLLGFEILPYTVMDALYWPDACFAAALESANAKYAAFPAAVAKLPTFLRHSMEGKLTVDLGGMRETIAATLDRPMFQDVAFPRLRAILETPLGKAVLTGLTCRSMVGQAFLATVRGTASARVCEEEDEYAAEPYEDLACGGAPECGRTCINPYCSDCK